MNYLIISTFGNKIFFEISNELRLFSKFKTKFYKNLDLCIQDSLKHEQIIIFFLTNKNENDYKKLMKINKEIPIILICMASLSKKVIFKKLLEKLDMPFNINDLEKKIFTLNSKYEFYKNSLISLSSYTIDKNERKIKKDNLELQLTEKEINFLILFSQKKEALTKDFVLQNVWFYSKDSDTHTVETHIHRLRKKILDKFGDNNFIKNNDKGYYI